MSLPTLGPEIVSGLSMLVGAGACAALALHLLSSLAIDLVDGRHDAVETRLARRPRES